MELTFVHHDSADPPKRRRLAKACESCRARKKRCVHFGGQDARGSSPEDDAGQPGLYGPATHPNGHPTGSTGQYGSTPSSASGARFISDLNPEAGLLDRPMPGNGVNQKKPNDDIGLWVDRREWDALVKQKNDAVNNASQSMATTNGMRQNRRPHHSAIAPLMDIYFKKVHPILPLLDDDEFKHSQNAGHVPEALIYAMCLTTAKDAEAEPHLLYTDSPSLVPPRQFCSTLHAHLTVALRTPLLYHRVTLIRILALVSLHNEGPEGAEEASIWLSQAMHYAQTLGIHLGQHASTPVGNDLLMKRLFWCLWSLDRTNAAINGRPIIMSDVDMAIEPFAPRESGFPAFEAWLEISTRLNQIIDFYRPDHKRAPNAPKSWDGDYPTLEELIDTVAGWSLPAPCLATIHLYHLTAGILSHRTRGVAEIPCGTNSNVRQRLFAIEILRLMNAPKSPTLHPLPILPYAISLALSVSYQHLRQSQLEHQQADARQDFRVCCAILQRLRRAWCSADVMATLARKVLEKLDAAEDLASFRIRRIVGAGVSGAVVANTGPGAGEGVKDLIPPPTACHYGPPPTADGLEDGEGADGRMHGQMEGGAMGPSAVEAGPAMQGATDGLNLFDNMDDVFGTFMDPNYPLNLEDMSFVEDLAPFDWNVDGSGVES